jgi:hypothetical protein
MNRVVAIRLTGCGAATGSFCQQRTFTRAPRNDLKWSLDVEPEPTLACHGRALSHVEALRRSIPLGSVPLEFDYPEADGEQFHGAK